MKYAVLFVSSAALALSACQQSDEATTEPAAAAEASETAEAAPAAAGAFTAGQPPAQEFRAGTWGEGDQCELPIEFLADGTINDGPFAKWDIQNGELTMDDAVRLKVTVVDADTLHSLNEGDTEPTVLKRCG